MSGLLLVFVGFMALAVLGFLFVEYVMFTPAERARLRETDEQRRERMTRIVADVNPALHAEMKRPRNVDRR